MSEVVVGVTPDVLNLLDRLANKIGTTTETIFPWYVKNQIIQGYWRLSVLITIIFLSITALIWAFNKEGFINEKEPGGIIMVIITSIILFFSALILCGEGGNAISMITNPEYWATAGLLHDLGELK